ncbi:MAG: outer membrane protein assembly factor BamD [Deltaproteobacteria bacterium]|nr:outer membrane protein assembly factor BamD [Deltaproteobacteria bacterium]
MLLQKQTICNILSLIAISVFVLFSCNKNKDSDSLLDYTQTAERQFQEAMDEFDDEDCVSAEKLFLDVRKKFPYSSYAVLAELRIADCQFIQGSHAEAAVLYQQFVKAHPTHEEAHYSSYRRGLCYHEMIPGDWVITPPPHERDQAATRDARAAFTRFLKTYPRSPWRDRAEELRQEVVDALVRHEMYVASFYLSRDDRLAASVRLEGIRKHFPESSLVPDAMFMHAVTFIKMNRKEEATRVFNEIITHFPDHHQSLRAKDYLKHLAEKTRGAKRGGDG